MHRLPGYSLMVAALLGRLAVSGQELAPAKPLSIGETWSMRSEVLGEERVVNVHLPADMGLDSTIRYHVIYLLDGSLEEDLIHVAGLVQFGSFPWVKMLPPSIVVGIANVDRVRDLTHPTSIEQDRREFPTSGGSARFITFITEELMPMIRARYPVSNGRTLIGQSFGGLLATEILLTRPALFQNYIIVSPSLWWDDGSLLRNDPVRVSTPRNVYVAWGEEGEGMDEAVRQLERLLKDREHLSTRFEKLTDHDHSNSLHMAVYKGWSWIFPR